MPSPKRWHPLSHDLINDPELLEFLRLFGDRALITWLWFLSALDRSENHLRLSGDWLASLSRQLRQTPASIRRQLGWMLAKGWLTAVQLAPDGSPTVLSSPNYWKYHRRREPAGSQAGFNERAKPDPLLSDPNLDEPNPPKVPAVEALARWGEFERQYPERSGKKVGLDRAREEFLKLSPEEQEQCAAAAKAYRKYCYEGTRLAKDPDRFLKEKDGRELWREFIPLKTTRPAPKPSAQSPTEEPTAPTEEARKELEKTENGRHLLAIYDSQMAIHTKTEAS